MARPKENYNKNIFIGLDIETTTFNTDRITQYDDALKNSNSCYLWGIGLYNFVDVLQGNFITRYEQKSLASEYIPFRTFDELDEFFTTFNNNKLKTICYVHNLSFETSFLVSNYIAKYGFNELFEIDENGNISLDNFMGDTPRKPFKLSFKKWHGIEFRCSLKILNDSLERVGKKFKFEKLKELKTYKELYFCDSELPLTEYQYNLRDIDVMAYAVVQTICKGNLWNAKNVDSMARVFSSTSFIKKQVRKFLGYFGELNFTKQLQDLNPRTIDDYNVINNAYVGGYTHANSRYRNTILKNVHSIDLTSAYPSIMACCKFPTKYKRSNYAEYQTRIKNHLTTGFIASVRFKCLRTKENKSGMCYIAESWKDPNYKSKGVCLNNGKIYSACDIVLVINSNQFSIIQEQYDYCNVKFSEVDFLLLSNYRYLNKNYINYIYELAKTKTDLKAITKDETLTLEERHNAEINLMKSKNNLNGQYGCFGMRPIRGCIYLNSQGLHQGKLTSNAENEALDKYTNNYYNLIIATEVTTLCHMQLFQAIDYLHKKGCKICYCDTDSIKFYGDIDGKQVCSDINKIMRKDMTNELSLKFINDFNFFGFDYEHCYEYAKFLGAKKYLTYNKNEFSITVAGVPKYRTNAIINEYAKTHTIEDTFNYWLSSGTRYKSKDTGKLSTRYYTHDLYYQNDDYITDENEKLCHVNDCYGVMLFECDYVLNESNYITEVWEETEPINGKGDR